MHSEGGDMTRRGKSEDATEPVAGAAPQPSVAAVQDRAVGLEAAAGRRTERAFLAIILAMAISEIGLLGWWWLAQ
jgi:hypothetical protein